MRPNLAEGALDWCGISHKGPSTPTLISIKAIAWTNQFWEVDVPFISLLLKKRLYPCEETNLLGINYRL